MTSTSLLLPGLELQVGDRDAENTLSLIATGTGRRLWDSAVIVANTRWQPTFGVLASSSRTEDLLRARATGFVNLPLWNTFEIGTGMDGAPAV